MRTAIHTRHQTPEHLSGRQLLVEALQRRGIEVVENWQSEPIDVLISIGGDGTLLNAVHLIGKRGIPVVGINFGHLGFLTTAGRDDIEKLADCLREGRYSIESRTMLEVEVLTGSELRRMYALNEVYLHRPDSSPLLHTQVEVDDDKVATIAADGLIVATPTGSTAYSLSCGGPILAPGSGGLVMTPIAAHTLTQRPVVLADTVSIRLRVEGDDVRFTLGVDSDSLTLDSRSEILIRKAAYRTQLMRIEHQNFFSAIRDKLMWGM